MADSAFKKSDFSFIQDFHNIIELILSGNNQDSIGKAVAHLEERFVHARQVLEELPGLHYAKEEQERLYQQELDLLEHKKKQLETYLSLPPFKKQQEQ
ncbi:hypothetical protein G6F46_000595 [Rhizopus delemar]|uniref:Mediator of RNA polymerase II transcription subunit 9 n=1 Tax=Rhizopus delemar (strain RA 99-880 / ATCC MYA-4621 / FGSC 9543 / NRRL 43880) TaxID=246409 RepID=I1C607_RHIO9|nr:hypothetical protein RO3G_08592 [Rhizopus delemar RA 99-880]KAG1047457.1 hypothetical protein G6F43_010097 [Rhizopus delemar]KAG1627597.1 hypothetical protein G6F45_007537 [Rhizopus arrhizus]KAG1452662.1 hypothetical protein G6F55_008556 [Rhizopus delemar]KAG1509522.1 hypothetical protein G6F53_007379 [Rhizopus delemar]|eukprot:EIE83887.1 hypothetical protein RO3G_08592 [Rhizopus delemar RA 99-880]